ncbi:MAG: putative transcriptional regulator [Bacteroidota bacterium]|nr:putative transcriptional regulator [Bacteroidota bacterium]
MEPYPKISQGSILVSEPFLNDPYFKRSVVLIAEEDADGILGFILNKPLKINITDIMNDFPEFTSPVYFGGPVQTEDLFYVHTINNLKDAQKITDNIYFGGSYEQLKLMVDIGKILPHMISFFVGYSGWDTGLIAQELAEKIWTLSEYNKKFLFNTDTSNLWTAVLKSMGGEYSIMANYPEDPQWN